ncbi:alginate O-acetyltransferase complex protein AlgI [Salirhabdus euzebyi]|uniref:Alginate O-acetyltransferase complex protein AlgI n=1 Tax=Salirhabdus euzebyi TaxID=394506 RepID=A0A841Q8B1_9BACI|nr:MBOAT family protein [Salirhabdus euzebyi]MBB6454563.1 alginate O-acetyltransferase complex protein AlgI [Salirhabdus euzebyi]
MVFSSPVFLFVFLPVVLIGYFLIRNRYKNIFLLIASLFFYSWGEPKYVLIMLLSIAINYFFGALVENYIDKKNLAKKIVAVAIIANLGILAFYKYLNFIVENINILIVKIGMEPIYLEPIDLPIGISFFTFQALSYVVDVYRRESRAQKNPLDLALYISLFPQLVAGPIVRYGDVAEQIKNRITQMEDINYGVKRFIIGLGKKVLIANPMGKIADEIFSLSGGDLSSGLAWLGIICYSLQIYYDFSGYSDMAIGLGRIFGFKFLENFNYPYISKSIKEFWRRWHISLSTWFRDYVYIPLGGSKTTRFNTYRNLLIVFIITGFWHGASWNFIIWGLFHGFFLVIERIGFGLVLERVWTPIKYLYTLLIVMIGWVFFRSETLDESINYITTMFNPFKITSNIYNVHYFITNEVLLILIIGIIGATPLLKIMTSKVENYVVSSNDIKYLIIRFFYGFLNPITYILVLIFSIMSLATSTYNPFIYFRF